VKPPASTTAAKILAFSKRSISSGRWGVRLSSFRRQSISPSPDYQIGLCR
jgi:hypothetical protein